VRLGVEQLERKASNWL